MIRKRPNQPPVCCCGEIGRRKGLKIPRWQHRTGSIPVSSTSCKTACFLAFRGTGGLLFACVKPSSRFSSTIFRLSFCQIAKIYVSNPEFLFPYADQKAPAFMLSGSFNVRQSLAIHAVSSLCFTFKCA